MSKLLQPDNETERLNTLRQYNILDTLTEADYEHITFMASMICDVPVALISFVDEHRQWFKSHKGLEASETLREYSFCAHALLSPEEALIVPDANLDLRFKDNPLVTGDPKIVFYAGIPLINDGGFGLGTVCIIDTKPRALTADQLAALKILSTQVMNLLEMRKTNADLKILKDQLENRNNKLIRFARQIEQNQSQLKTITESMNVLLAVADESSKAIYFSNAWENLTGKSIQDLLDFNWAELIHPEDKDRYVNIYLDAFKERQSFSGEFRIKNSAGGYTHLLSQSSPQILKDGSFIGYISSTIDISALKDVESQLVKTSNRLQLALNAGQLGVYELDIATGKMVTSLQCRKNFGKSADDNFDFPDLLEMIFPEDLEQMQQAVNNAIVNKKVYNAVYRISVPEKGTRWIQASGLPVYDDNDQPIEMTGVTVDITAQKAFTDNLEEQVSARTQELEQKNIDLEKMNKELESFAYISSHDLQEPLRKIQTFTSRISDKESDNLSEKGKDYFNRIQAAAKRMQFLIKDLLVYSKTNSSERVFEMVELNEVVEKVMQNMDETIHENNAIITINGSAKAKIIRFQFEQLIQNLLSNAMKFSKDNTQPQIQISIGLTDDSEAACHAPGKKYCHISVADNGIGFDKEYSKKIFELFQRLHSPREYSGTGIGLAIVKKIVDNHDGIITAHGELDKGAIFDICIPVE